MVRLDCCIGGGCDFKTQDLAWDQAEKVLTMHLDRKHPSRDSLPVTLPSDRRRSPALQRKSDSEPERPTLPDEASTSTAAQFPMPPPQYYVSLSGFPIHDGAKKKC